MCRNTSYLSLMRCTLATGKCAITATSPMKMPKAMPAWCTDWQNAVPTNGEGFQAFTRRVERFISRLDAFSDCQNLLIVSHQGVLSLLIARLLTMPAASLWHFRVEQGCWSAIDICEGFATLKVVK
ncbi:alpha-ribazole-5'-phosphate phosphatase [Salmonella enterica subsp. enterica serovar Typhimurium]|nr:alpha-ribazole-5'-phosphate phosphatase [Salmonella enterica subsp. enterica serovar Typhimurium]